MTVKVAYLLPMVEARDGRQRLNSSEARAARSDWASLAHPQAGVDALSAALPGEKAPAGVSDNGDTRARGVLMMMIKKE